MEQEQEHVFVNAFLFLFPKCSLSVHEHGKERRTLNMFFRIRVNLYRAGCKKFPGVQSLAQAVVALVT